MKIYITLEENITTMEYERCKEMLKKNSCNIIGTYESRGYETLVVDIGAHEESIIEQICKVVPILEVRKAMKFYCSLDRGIYPVQVNPIIREKLSKSGYNARVYPAHTENGVLYIGIEIEDMNPLDELELQEYMKVINVIKGISQLSFY